MLVAVAPVRVPQAFAEHPLPVSVQLTPLLLGSFCTLALTTNGLAAVLTDVKEFEIAMDSAVALMVNVSESDLLVFATDLAVRVGWLLGDAGAELGGVYITPAEVAPESVPHAGEQLAPLAVRLQVTPLFVESFWTVAVNEIAAAPA